MSDRKICVFCLTENAADAVECSNCHAPFQPDLRTPVVASDIGDLLLSGHPEYSDSRTESSLLTLHVVSEKQPIRITRMGRFVLGRSLQDSDQPSIDLSPYGAHLLGVSRQHAALTITDDACTVEDLSSMNGTWLNEHRLTPAQNVNINNGDLLRLGLLMLFISKRG